MAIRKLKTQTQKTDVRLQLEADEPVELPPAEVDESAAVVQFDQMKPFVPELLETLRAGTVAELVPVMRDGSTFAIHTRTRTFWVKLWHASSERTKVDRVQVLSCMPSTRGVQIVFDDPAQAADDYDDEETLDDDDAAGERPVEDADGPRGN
ncbi:MAG: hypothetical protein ACRD9R_22715 [Pyrinomonadaceae bacterium]